jgi:hypothetical protein
MSLICRVDHHVAYRLSAYPMLLSPILPLSFQAASPFLGGQVLGDKTYQVLKTVKNGESGSYTQQMTVSPRVAVAKTRKCFSTFCLAEFNRSWPQGCEPQNSSSRTEEQKDHDFRDSGCMLTTVYPSMLPKQNTIT